MKKLPNMPDMMFNKIHLKRAVYYVGPVFTRLEFDTLENVTRVVDGKEIVGGFEFSPSDYDYNDRNEVIDTAFSYWLAAPYDGTVVTFRATFIDGIKRVSVINETGTILFSGQVK